LVERGVEVAVVTRRERGSYSELFDVPIYRTGFLDVGVRSSKISHSFTVVPTLRRVLKEGGFDVVHSHNPPAAIPASWCAGRQGLPHVTTMHGPWADVRLHTASRFLCKMVERKALRDADHVTCDSKRLAEDVLAWYGLEVAKVTAIQNAVETDRFSPAISKREARDRLGLSAGDKIVLYTGRFLVEKGITYLLEAIEGIAKETDDVSFLLVGGGFDEHVVSDWLAKTKLQRRVTIIPYVEYERMPSVYAAADVLVQPSLAEGLSRSILEAMACGLPIVATDVGGNPELVSGRNGVLVKPRSAAAIKQALASVLSDDVARAAMGRESRRRAVSEFSVRRRIQSFIEVYDRVCGS